MDVGESLTRAGYTVHTFGSCAAAAEWLAVNPDPSIAVVDVELLDGRCDDIAAELTDRNVPFVVHSARSELHLPEDQAFAAGTWLSKPTDTATLMATIRDVASFALPVRERPPS
jgi:DNA-binding response OmpR family regulator